MGWASARRRDGRQWQTADCPEIYAEAERRGIGVAALSTADACRLLADMKAGDVYAVLHVTC